MKKIIALLAVLALAASMVAALGEGTLYDEVMARGSLIIGTEGMWSPWTYHDLDTDELVGFDVEVGKAI